MATMLYRIRTAETGFDASKIFVLEDKERSSAPKKFEDEELEELLAELGKIS